MKQKFVFLLLLPLFILWLPNIRPAASDPGVPHEMGIQDVVLDTSQDIGADSQGDGMDQDNAPGMDTPDDGQQGDAIAALQTLMAQYQTDSGRRQTDSEILRFALAAAFSLWAGRKITQRRPR